MSCTGREKPGIDKKRYYEFSSISFKFSNCNCNYFCNWKLILYLNINYTDTICLQNASYSCLLLGEYCISMLAWWKAVILVFSRKRATTRHTVSWELLHYCSEKPGYVVIIGVFYSMVVKCTSSGSSLIWFIISILKSRSCVAYAKVYTSFTSVYSSTQINKQINKQKK